jgi:regulator of protease activity HflC (stomatin/prohibitin superfamily)
LSQIIKLGAIVLFVVLACVGTGLYGCPSYNVYTSKMEGQAELAKAEASKQVAVQTAKAKYESADYEAKAEVRRAEGVRDANKIIGDGLKGNEDYLRYLYINNLATSHDQIIYVPTEGAMPILEAGHRPERPAAPSQDDAGSKKK